MIDDLRIRYLPRFVGIAEQRVNRGLQLLTAPADAKPGAVADEFHALAGEASILGLSELSQVARTGEAAGRRLAGGQRNARVECARYWREAGRLVKQIREQLTDDTPTKVLIIDDSSIVAMQVADALEDAKFIAHTATDRASAVQVVEAERPKLALVDVNLGDVDVDTMCAALRTADPELQIVLVSGMTEAELSELSVRLSAAGYVPKQAGVDAIVVRVRELVAEAAE